MLSVVRAVLALVGFVLFAAGFVAFAGAAVGVWWAKAEADRRTAALAGRAHAAIDRADHAVGFVRGVVRQADADLERARASAAAAPSEAVNPLVQIGARQASQELAGSVDRASAAVVTASDAVVVATTALELFDRDEELRTWFPVAPEQLAQTRTDLSAAGRELSKARTVLGIPVAPAGTPTADQLNAIATGLAQARTLTYQMGGLVTNTRARVDETKARVDRWVWWTALAATAVGVLGAGGQFFAARACWRVLRGRPA